MPIYFENKKKNLQILNQPEVYKSRFSKARGEVSEW